MDRQLLRQRLDELAGRAQRFLARWSLHRDLRIACRDALVWLLAAPVLFLLVQVSLILVARTALTWSVWVWVLLSASGPVFVVAASVVWLAARRRLDRRSCLGVFDRQLDTQDRLVIADEFLAEASSVAGRGMPRPYDDRPHAGVDPFKEAAIDDATPSVEQALQTTLDPRALPAWTISRRSWVSVPATAVVILLAVWFGRTAIGLGATPVAESVLAGADLQTLPARIAAALLDHRPAPSRPSRTPADEPANANDARSSYEASPRSTKSDQDAEGQSHAGGQASSRSSSQAMTASGTPSNQQTPSKALEEDPPQEQKADAATQAKKADGKKGQQQATSATSGQGQSRSSSSDSNTIPATDQPDRAGANKDSGKDEEGIQDEVEEEKTSGVERPSLRKNKPPIDRNLSPRPTGDQPNPNANGRSGPGGRKKTRGVPAMILGVPTPDRIQGMTSPGRSKVTQENSTPKEEPQTALSAEERRARETPFGHIEHPRMQPWMQNLIEKYFLQLREKPPGTPTIKKGAK